MYLITSILHLIQPLARLIGRLKHGLTPWRNRGTEFFVLPVSKTISYWSENWRDATDRLAAIEKALQAERAIVRRNSDFDEGWDLQVRGGIFGNTQLLVLTEEHGQGRQVIRARAIGKGTFFVHVLVIILVLLSLFAASDGAILAAIITGSAAILVVMQAVLEAGRSTSTVLLAIDEVREEEGGVILSPDNRAVSREKGKSLIKKTKNRRKSESAAHLKQGL